MHMKDMLNLAGFDAARQPIGGDAAHHIKAAAVVTAWARSSETAREPGSIIGDRSVRSASMSGRSPNATEAGEP